MAKKRGRKIYKSKRRKTAVALALKIIAAIIILVAVIFIVLKFGKNSELALYINSYDYSVLTKSSEEGRETAKAEDTDGLTEDELPANVFALKGDYPIDASIESKYAVVYDVVAKKILFAKDAEARIYPASTTKILTSAVVIDNLTDEDFVFTAGDELDFVNPGSSLAYINKGNALDLEMMIDALMIPSGNDAAYVAAANVGNEIIGTDGISPEMAVGAFIDEMNRTLKKIGADNSHFTNPDGFHDDGHYTTAIDLLKITLYSSDKELIKKSAMKPSRYAVFLTGEAVSWENSNKLIQDSSDRHYTYATGMKTGMTNMSGYCVVATAERFGHEVICIVMGADTSDIRWNDTIALLDASFAYIGNQ